MADKKDELELRNAGLKVTHPRLTILKLMEQHRDSHLSAEDVYKRLLEQNEEIGLATVYRVLTQFEAAGLVIKHNFAGGQAIFEMSDGQHHDHMVDTNSGEVIEFFDAELERLQHEIAEKHGFELVDHSLVLYVKPKSKK